MTNCAHCPFSVTEVEELQEIREVLVPAGIKFRQIVVTGPPCTGKSTLVRKMGGWPEEGYLDLAQRNWWSSQVLTFRPREVHFGLPFVGFEKSYAVFDKKWVDQPARIDFSRILLPPPKKNLFQVDWLNRYGFDFQLPSPDEVYRSSKQRKRGGTHPVDVEVNLELVQRQIAVYAELALLFQRHGMIVWIRNRYDGLPLRIEDNSSGEAAAG